MKAMRLGNTGGGGGGAWSDDECYDNAPPATSPPVTAENVAKPAVESSDIKSNGVVMSRSERRALRRSRTPPANSSNHFNAPTTAETLSLSSLSASTTVRIAATPSLPMSNPFVALSRTDSSDGNDGTDHKKG